MEERSLTDSKTRLDTHIKGRDDLKGIGLSKPLSSREDEETARPHGFGPLKGASPAMLQLYRIIEKVAATDTTVFLRGESGTGKELIARTLHTLGDRSHGRFVAVNCGAVAHDTIERELCSDGENLVGSLFLDEITTMSAELQTYLLRLLDEAGSRDIRVIAATNRDPEEAIRSSHLRDDLFFRLAAFPIRVPPLRSRAGDIPLLARHFLNVLNVENSTVKRLTPEAIDTLEAHSWPGNVRELQNAVHSAYILSDGDIRPRDLPVWAPKRQSDPGDLRFRVGVSLDEVQRELIYATLEHFNGNKRYAAETLQVSLKTLYNRLKRYERGSRV